MVEWDRTSFEIYKSNGCVGIKLAVGRHPPLADAPILINSIQTILVFLVRGWGSRKKRSHGN